MFFIKLTKKYIYCNKKTLEKAQITAIIKKKAYEKADIFVSIFNSLNFLPGIIQG